MVTPYSMAPVGMASTPVAAPVGSTGPGVHNAGPHNLQEAMQEQDKFNRIVVAAEREAGVPDTVSVGSGAPTTMSPNEVTAEEEKNGGFVVLLVLCILFAIGAVGSFCLYENKDKLTAGGGYGPMPEQAEGAARMGTPPGST